MKILIMGGTRFVGKPLVTRLQAQGHALTLFTRGRHSLPDGVEHLSGDRTTPEGLSRLQGRSFDVIVDSSGRKLEDSQRVVACTGEPKHRFLYVSSAGVYADSEEWPLNEESATDPNSRHAGKAQTESWLLQQGIPFTSFRPTYIYGPGNYNPIERWFFDRIVHNRPIPLPRDGTTITQLGHVVDLADAMVRSLEVETATNRIYNCSSKRGITFRGLIAAAARACGKDPNAVELSSFDPSGLNPKARKAFPLRLSHFLTDITRVERELAWQPRFDLETGLEDSYCNDYSLKPTAEPDFSADQSLIGV
ncbi:NAD-dependent epimerase/dehydratase family protein [Prochlorococcus marinus]|uniref:NAD-dependent epimerase/dehydratase family protein n=1 Tax=Prochlorococcus marinus TaxID=1219 RepID=UPI001F434AFB|nr:NAD-dependent epimerase/dehydratase family protein [Prochlorococcus marinus]